MTVSVLDSVELPGRALQLLQARFVLLESRKEEEVPESEVVAAAVRLYINRFYPVRLSNLSLFIIFRLSTAHAFTLCIGTELRIGFLSTLFSVRVGYSLC